jgi:DNA processing protein
MHPELRYRIALTMVDGIGHSLAKNLISYCGNAKAVFTEKKSILKKIPGIGPMTAESISKFKGFVEIEEEMKKLEKHKIQAIYYLDAEYPVRLKNCDDGPVMLYFKGNADLNAKRMISIVGTRKSTPYGKQFTEELVQALEPYDVTILSGLALGIDTYAHRFAVEHQLPTIGVMGHGFHTIYPASNRQLAIEMLENGGLLTEFKFTMPGNKENFPQRNRIVAGMSDAVIVIESSLRGGSLITAEYGNQYNRDVYALPGRLTDMASQGCNKLIHDHKAAVIDSVSGLINDLGYDLAQKRQENHQLSLLPSLSAQELLVYEYLQTGDKGIDDLHYHTKMTVSHLALILLDLEFKGIIKAMPGKTYGLVQSMR